MALCVRWFPQSFVQIRSKDHLIYFDPSLSSTPGDMLRSSLFPGRAKGELPDGLEEGDLILVTHHHLDHVVKGMVDRLSNERTRVLAPIKCQKKLGEDISVVGPGQLISHDDLGIEVIFAYNPPRKAGITYHKKGECVGYVLEIEGKRIYHAGDTGLIEEMSGLGRIDLALLPIGGRFTLDIDEAVEAVKIINPALVVPMHMLKADPHKFRELVEEKTSSTAKVLAPGEKLDLEN